MRIISMDNRAKVEHFLNQVRADPDFRITWIFPNYRRAGAVAGESLRMYSKILINYNNNNDNKYYYCYYYILGK